jgi:hypothetical protein
MAIFDSFIKKIETGVVSLAENTIKGFGKEALKDSKDFLKKTEKDLKRWTNMLASGELSRDDFEDLVMGRKDLLEMYSLQQAGLALVELDRFRNSLISLIVDTAFGEFL